MTAWYQLRLWPFHIGESWQCPLQKKWRTVLAIAQTYAINLSLLRMRQCSRQVLLATIPDDECTDRLSDTNWYLAVQCLQLRLKCRLNSAQTYGQNWSNTLVSLGHLDEKSKTFEDPHTASSFGDLRSTRNIYI